METTIVNRGDIVFGWSILGRLRRENTMLGYGRNVET